MIPITSNFLLVAVAACVLAQAGCARSSSPGASHAPAESTQRALSARVAAKLAARLANEQCEQQYRKRPFKPEQHAAVLNDGMYRWGGLDVGGPGGFSALVTFRPDGSESHVEVYYSSDVLFPRTSPVQRPPNVAPKGN